MFAVAASFVFLQQSFRGEYVLQLLPQTITYLAHVMGLLVMFFELIVALIVNELQFRCIEVAHLTLEM